MNNEITIPQFKLVTAKSVPTFNERINQHIAAGWKFIAATPIYFEKNKNGDTQFAAAMILEPAMPMPVLPPMTAEDVELGQEPPAVKKGLFGKKNG